jgi:hypothetical protein
MIEVIRMKLGYRVLRYLRLAMRALLGEVPLLVVLVGFYT